MTEPRRTQEERRGEAEKRLLGAAAELIAETGPSGVTLANIGERAGYSRGLATHHFGSKGAMMQRLVASVTTDLRREVIAATATDSALDEAMGLVRAYFHALEHPRPANRARLVLWADAVAAGSSEVRSAVLASDREFRDELTERIERGVRRVSSRGRSIRALSRRSSSECCGVSRCNRCSTTGWTSTRAVSKWRRS